MRTTHLIAFGLLVGCKPQPAILDSGSYVPAVPPDAKGLQGVNLTLQQELALFVTADAIVERVITPVDEKDWVVGCKDAHSDGISEQTMTVDPEPVELPDQTVTFDTLSAWCDGDDGEGIRLVATDPPGFELVLTRF